MPNDQPTTDAPDAEGDNAMTTEDALIIDEIIVDDSAADATDEVEFDDKVKVAFEEQDGIWFPVFEKVR